MRTCPRCNQPVSDGAKHCGHCGILLPLSAPRFCPNGHPLNPRTSDKECPVCVSAAMSPSRPETRIASGPPPPPVPATSAVEAPPKPPPTPNARPKTVFRGVPAAQASEIQAGRRIVGVLVTYSWKPEGEVFFLRDGRNIIGRDSAESDIAIPNDPEMSSRNTFIAYRKNFVIADAMSLGGTDMDGEPVEEQKRLRNYSTLRTGSTFWTFISFDPESDEVGG